MTNETQTAPPIGDNNPPSDEQILRDGLICTNGDLTNKIEEIGEGFEKAPKAVEDEETAEKVIAFIKSINNTLKVCEKRRVEEKAPVTARGKTIEAFFKELKADLDAPKAALTKILSTYQTAKALEERAKRELLAEEARKEAEEKTETAETEGQLTAAVNADNKAASFKKRADESTAKMSGTTTLDGASASVRSSWVGEIVDVKEIPLDILRPYLKPEHIEQAIRGFIKGGGRELKGVEIKENFTSVVR